MQHGIAGNYYFSRYDFREDPFLEIRPGLKKPKQNFPVIQSIQQSDYSFKPLNPAGLFLSATWKAPKIIFKTKSSFQVSDPLYI